LCEKIFCCHWGQIILLEVAKEDFTDVKVILGSNFMTLKEHVREAHGGFWACSNVTGRCRESNQREGVIVSTRRENVGKSRSQD